MIKKTILLTLLLFLIAVFPSFAKQQEIKIRTEISHVDIYPDSAVITRKGETGLLSAGNYRLIFNNIIEDFIDGSLHAGISKNIKDRATINGVNIETVFVLDEPEEKVRQLRE